MIMERDAFAHTKHFHQIPKHRHWIAVSNHGKKELHVYDIILLYQMAWGFSSAVDGLPAYVGGQPFFWGTLRETYILSI